MARRPRPIQTVEQLTEDINERLRKLREGASGLSLRDKVRHLAEVQYRLRCISVSVAADEGLSATAAIERLKTYLHRHPNIVIDGTELEVIAGVSEYARRIRQLRVEEGFRIATGASPDAFSGIDLKPDQYLLTSVEVDADLARRWRIANGIRRTPVSVKERILAFLKANVTKVVTTEELAYVSKDRREFGKATRDLRTEDGFMVATRFTGRPDLSVGEYVLLSGDRRAEEHDRHVPDAVLKEVYERDQNTCRNPECRYRWTPASPRILEVHRFVAHGRLGANTADTLLVLCDQCHDAAHENRLNIMGCIAGV
jgi:hypothetical protein